MRTADTISKVEAGLDRIVHDGANSARHTAKELGYRAEAILQDGQESASRLAKLVQDTSHGMVESLRENIRAKPAMTVGIAAGVGIVLGLLLAARR